MPDPETADSALGQLQRAFDQQDAAQFRSVLSRHPNLKAGINATVGPFDSPLITRVRSVEMLDALLEAGADINAKSRWWAGGFGLLHLAEPALAQEAIRRGATVDLHAAARLGMMDRVRELVAGHPELVKSRGGDGQTPLHFACSTEIADFLLDHGADLNARDVDHESTPVQYMVRDRQPVSRRLIERGCETDLLLAAALGDLPLVRRHLEERPECIRMRVSEDYFPKSDPRAGGTIYQWTLGWHVSALDVAREFNHSEVLGLLNQRSPPEVQFVDACWSGDEARAKALLAQDPGLSSRFNEIDRRQLVHAARNNNVVAVRLMLEAGWAVNVLGQHRATPLHWAAFHGNAEMAAEILPHSPPLEQLDGDFQGTPLGWAIHGSQHGWYRDSGDYAKVVELLLKAGARLPQTTTAGSAAVQAVLQRSEA